MEYILKCINFGAAWGTCGAWLPQVLGRVDAAIVLSQSFVFVARCLRRQFCALVLLFSASHLLRVLMMQLDCVHGIRVAAFLHFRVGATRSVRRAGCVGQNAKLRIAQVERRQASESRLRRRRGFCVDMFVVISGVTVLAPMLRHTYTYINKYAYIYCTS